MKKVFQSFISSLIMFLMVLVPVPQNARAEITDSSVQQFHSSYQYPGEEVCKEFAVSDTNDQNASAEGPKEQKGSFLTPELINQVNVMLIGMLAPIIPMQCKDFYVSPPLLIYMATGVTYLIVEFNTAKAQKKAMDDLSAIGEVDTSPDRAEGTDVQAAMKAPLDGLAKKALGTEQSKKSVEERKKQYSIVATMMTVAAVAAIALGVMENIPYTATVAKNLTPKSCAGGGGNRNAKKAIAAAIAFVWSFAQQYAASGGKDFKAGGALVGSALSGAGAAMTSGKVVVSGATLKMTKVLNKGLDKAAENAPAEKAFGTNFVMGVVFGAQAGLAWWGNSMLKKKVKEQEAQYTSDLCLYGDLKKTADAAGNTCIPTAEKPCTEIPNMPDLDMPDIDKYEKNPKNGKGKKQNLATIKLDDKAAVHCASADPEIGVNISTNCSKPVKFNNDFKPFPDGSFPSLHLDMADASNYANALASGKYAEADAHGNKLLKNASRINADFEKAKKIMNAKMKEKGHKNFDYDKEMEKAKAMEIGNVTSALQEAAGEAPNSATLAALNAPVKAEVDGEKENLGGSTSGGPGTAPGITENSGKKSEEALDLGLGDATDMGLADGSSDKAEDKLDAYLVEESDITNKPDVSLFKLLSNRYILSYPKVLEEAAPAPNAETEAASGPAKSLDDSLKSLKK